MLRVGVQHEHSVLCPVGGGGHERQAHHSAESRVRRRVEDGTQAVPVGIWGFKDKDDYY